MNTFDIILTAVILIAVIAVIIIMARNRKKGKTCPCDCASCTYKCREKRDGNTR